MNETLNFQTCCMQNDGIFAEKQERSFCTAKAPLLFFSKRFCEYCEINKSLTKGLVKLTML